MVKISSLTDAYGVFSYKSPLIAFAVENFQNWRHRELAIKADPIAKTYICKLDEEILSEKPIFTPDIFGASTSEITPDVEELRKTPEADDVSEEWEIENWDRLLLEIFNMARTHAFCVVQLYDRKPFWRVFTDREIQTIQYDKNDNPIGCTVEWTKSMHKGDFLRYHKETCVFYEEKRENNDGTALFVSFGIPTGQNLGEYDLEHLWDAMIWLRYIILDIVNNSAKSSGFYHFMYGDSLSDTERDKLVNAADIAGGMRAIGAKENALKQIIAMYPPQAQFSIEAAEELMLFIAGASRLPLSFYRGERETGGMNSGFAGYIDESKVTAKKKFIFRQFAKYIKKLVEMRWGIVIEDVIPYIESEQKPMEFESFSTENNENKKNKNLSEESLNA